MAYTRKPKRFRISFDADHTLAGLELVTRSLSMREFVEIGEPFTKLQGVDVTDPEAGFDALKELDASLMFCREFFADKLVEWNMEEEDGSPTPISIDGVSLIEDMDFIELLKGWLEGMSGVSPELGKVSSSGVSYPELSVPMVPLSASQAS